MINDKYKHQREWDKENKERFYIECMKITEADIIAKLRQKPKYATYIKQLIREDIKKEGAE